MSKTWTLAELADATQTTVQGNADKLIQAVASIEQAQAHELSYIRDRKYFNLLNTSKAGALILTADLAAQYQGDALISRNPYLTYARVVTLFNPLHRPAAGIHPSAVIADDVSLGADIHIGANAVLESGVKVGAGTVISAGCYLGRNVHLGADSFLYPKVILYSDTEVGERAIIHSGAVIGADGFGFVPESTGWYKIPQIGNVILGDDVEIGANTCLDRAAMGSTRLGHGVKLDNLIHIAHNVQIGDHTVIAACTGIAGSAKIGSHCQISGMCSIAGHLVIADRVTITGTSFVINSITEPGVYSSGVTVEEHGLWRKNAVRFRQLDQMARRLASLEKQLAELQNNKD
ncbi:UDP-3-O-(3-hydroxymyristoyl)glucosamine N-acyltransferase [uncultured Thiothrix sp.]|uniref:UDP-3-O-(3-hydroxymyristoyl)glucosamine N-acyltransferase n=1 Tax=uncultured Thiothrix sp. TaxID=223185 RepID=UPI00260D80A1|nr:UDP-3-O-(3-hydroxymyristoyl)glucosamine N-acyltransferase [uncultured Thiothrix sp.]